MVREGNHYGDSATHSLIFIYSNSLILQLNFKNNHRPWDIDPSSFSQHCWCFQFQFVCVLLKLFCGDNGFSNQVRTFFPFLTRVFFFITKLLNLERNWILSCFIDFLISFQYSLVLYFSKNVKSNLQIHGGELVLELETDNWIWIFLVESWISWNAVDLNNLCPFYGRTGLMETPRSKPSPPRLSKKHNAAKSDGTSSSSSSSPAVPNTRLSLDRTSPPPQTFNSKPTRTTRVPTPDVSFFCLFGSKNFKDLSSLDIFRKCHYGRSCNLSWLKSRRI